MFHARNGFFDKMWTVSFYEDIASQCFGHKNGFHWNLGHLNLRGYKSCHIFFLSSCCLYGKDFCGWLRGCLQALSLLDLACLTRLQNRRYQLDNKAYYADCAYTQEAYLC